MQKEPEQEQIQENNNAISNPINNDKTYFKKNKIKKEIYDEEDLIMQKILIEDFPKKCKEENRFVRISKNEYSFGEERIKVIYKDGEVILKLDEGDYRLQEFIDILNEGKNEEENFDNEIINKENIEQVQEQEQIQQQEQIQDQGQLPEPEQDQDQIKEQEQEEINDNKIEKVLNCNKKEIKEINDNKIIDDANKEKQINEGNEINNSEKKENDSEKLSNKSLSSEKKHKKRRKKRVSEDNSYEKEIAEKEENLQNNNIEKKEIVIDKENENNSNNDNINYENKISNTEGNESSINSENKGRKYVIKRRRDYLQKKLK
jgi:hypothetical protein